MPETRYNKSRKRHMPETIRRCMLCQEEMELAQWAQDQRPEEVEAHAQVLTQQGIVLVLDWD